jgi:hypothetical protein
MRHVRLLKTSLFTLIPLIFLLNFLQTDSKVLAAGQLHNLSDVVNSNVLEVSTEHFISFTLPSDSTPINKTDYVQVYLAAFADVTAPNDVEGDYAGDPVFSVDGNYAKVTGIRVLAGGYLEIHGITATSPPSEDLFQVIVMVTEDEAGLEVKNISNAIATVNRGSVSVSASIPRELASLVISGYTSPLNYLIFSEDQVVIGTDVANPVGSFSKYFSGLQPTTHTISFYGIDQQDRITSPIPITIYTPAYVQTLISNQLLSPTLEIDNSQYTTGNPVIASGSAMPGGEITLFTDSPLRSYSTIASSSGNWTLTINDTNDYVPGDYRIYALVQNEYGLQSLFSPSIIFRMLSNLPSGIACGDISRGDINCDGMVDLIDFSIMMYYWATSSAEADINLDATVNLIDFSIMMYYWGT